MGATDITVFDKDILSPENIAPSYASQKYLGQPKVSALMQKIYEETGTEIKGRIQSFGRQRGTTNIMIISVDSLNMRRYIWNNHNYEYDLWIDARMGDDQAGVYTHIKGCSTDYYESTLNRVEADMPCGTKATSPISVGLVPGMVGVVVMRYLNQLTIPKEMFAKTLMPLMFFSIGDSHRPVSEVGVGIDRGIHN